jgi:phosphoribosylformylglycinamidine (FGAM) synthase PurS component
MGTKEVVNRRFLVHVAIVLRGSRDPEGETILKDVIVASGFNGVSKVRSGKYLGFTVSAANSEEAAKIVSGLCYRLRIYNPTVHELLVLGVEDEGCGD